MFYSVFVLGKKGPLARVWLAAHWDKKITKAQILETNIVESVDSILQPRVKLSLRTSSHLLLGIVRIYARKTIYLLQDCQDAAFKIKSAFRPGAVDLPDGKTEAAISAITLPEMLDFVNDFDLLAEPPVQIEPIQTNTNVRNITLIEELATEVSDVFGGGLEKGWTEYSSIQISSNSKNDESSIKDSQNMSSHPLDIFDRPAVDDGFGGPVGMADVDDMFALPVPPEAQQQMQAEAEAEAARDKVNEEADRPISRLSDRSDSMGSYDAPPSLAPSVPSTPGSNLPMNEDNDMEEPANNQDNVANKAAEYDQEQDSNISRPDDVFKKPATQESMVLEPLGDGPGPFERRRKRRKKLGIIIDEVKVLSGEEMKAQLSDTSDIITTLDLAPPTKKLMHWKRTGGSEKLFALSERPIPSKVLIVYYTRHLVTTRIEVEEELPEELVNGDLSEHVDSYSTRRHATEDFSEQLLPPISPLKEIQPPKTPRTPRRETDSHKSPVKKKRKTADEREREKAEKAERLEQRKAKSSLHSDRISHLQTDSRIDDSALSELRHGSVHSPNYENISSIRNNNSNYQEMDDDEQYQDQYEQPLSVGPPEEMMPDETAEQYEERMRNKRTCVLLRLMSKQLEEGAVSFTRLVSHNRRKQVLF